MTTMTVTTPTVDLERGFDVMEMLRLGIPLTLLIDLADLEEARLHPRIPPNTNSVNCGTRLCACRLPSGLYHW